MSHPVFSAIKCNAETRARILDGTAFGQFFQWRELQALAEVMPLVKVARGATIFRQGDTSRFLALVCEGRVSIRLETDKGETRSLGEVRPGRTFGELPLLDHQPRSASAVAVEDSRLMLMNREDFSRLAEKYPRVWGKLVLYVARLLSQRLRARSAEVAALLEQDGAGD